MPSRPFIGNNARPAFAVYKEPLEAGEYSSSKKNKLFCFSDACHWRKPLGTEKNLLLFKNFVNDRRSGNAINTYQLYINLLTKLNMKDVPVISSIPDGISPVAIDPAAIPYYVYNVDPSGNLFGNTPCGLQNYVQYMECKTL